MKIPNTDIKLISVPIEHRVKKLKTEVTFGTLDVLFHGFDEEIERKLLESLNAELDNCVLNKLLESGSLSITDGNETN